MKITKKTNINELLMKKPELAPLLLSSGMNCIGCPIAKVENLEDACRAHGMSAEQIDKFVEQLNKEVGFFKKEPTMVESYNKKEPTMVESKSKTGRKGK
jgi:hybrid cluster-associated redox disulfide protein